VDPSYRVDVARADDVPSLAAIELRAGRLLRDHAPAAVLNEVTDQATLRHAARAGRLWVARRHDVPVGFALVEMLGPDRPHLEEVAVDPDHGRRGVGAALVRAVCEWAGRSGYEDVTLTTFRDVPWNMPFYAKLGFVAVPADGLGSALAAVVGNEAARGLDPARRVVMSYRPPPGDRDPARRLR
jgi:GNAT superfamily N-acetyltransferase